MGVFDLLMGALDSIAQPEGREIDPVADTSVVSIPLYIRRDGAGALVPVRHIRPKITKRTYGLAVHLHGPSEYYLDQVEQWPSGGDVCIYANVRADGDHSLYVRVDDVHRAVCAALALRQAIVRWSLPGGIPMRRFTQIVTALVLLVSAAALAGEGGCASAQSLPTAAPVIAPVPTAPAADTVALATDSSLWRTDLQQALLVSAAQAVRQAGFTVSNPVGDGPTVVQVMPMGQTAVTVPTITLTVNVGMYTSSTFYVSRHSESVMVTATLVLPDTRMFRTTDNETASWFSTYIPLPYTYSSWMPFGGSTQVGTPQQPAERRAAAQAAAKAVTALLSVLGPASH